MTKAIVNAAMKLPTVIIGFFCHGSDFLEINGPDFVKKNVNV